jgi:stage V sporulation protein AD
MKRIGKQTWQFQEGVYISSTGTSVGPKEANGPMGSYVDKTYNDLHCGEDNWELAERRLLEDAVTSCLQKGAKTEDEVDFFLAGDLLNQNVTPNYIARQNQIPYLCMFGACSTSMETLAVGSVLVDGGYADQVLAAVSSHNATAERQFRYPTEYGGQKPDTATLTVTGAGAALVNRDVSPIKITGATIGKVVDWGAKDPFDLGAAMAPAAANTISSHFHDTGKKPNDYDMIVTGDLSSVGSPILKEMMSEDGYDLSSVHQDCGLMVYSPEQKMMAGGSGTACSAVVTYGYLIEEMKKGNLQCILVVATGALFNPFMVQQKESIPCIAHGVVLEASGGDGS